MPIRTNKLKIQVIFDDISPLSCTVVQKNGFGPPIYRGMVITITITESQ